MRVGSESVAAAAVGSVAAAAGSVAAAAVVSVAAAADFENEVLTECEVEAAETELPANAKTGCAFVGAEKSAGSASRRTR